jgi:predicted metal-dependent phosphoesterase TrpH
MKVDLHFHSKYSDGLFFPDELVKIAKKKQLEMIALTDHDTFEGVEDFLKATKQYDIIGIPAIEIDFKDDLFGFKSELLAYFPAGNYSNTQNYISHFQDLRKKIAEFSIEKAKFQYNLLNLDITELLENKIGKNLNPEIYKKISLTKPDIFKYFNDKKISHGYTDYQDFKNKFFDDDIFARLNAKPDFSKCIELINSDNGFAVLAHPAYQFNKNEAEITKNETNYKAMLKKAKELGLWGIEMHAYENPQESDKMNAIFKDFANQCGLNLTYGSDFHGENTRNKRELGCVKSDFEGFLRA